MTTDKPTPDPNAQPPPELAPLAVLPVFGELLSGVDDEARDLAILARMEEYEYGAAAAQAAVMETAEIRAAMSLGEDGL